MLIRKEIGHSSPLSVGNYNPGQKKRKHFSMIKTGISIRIALVKTFFPTDLNLRKRKGKIE